MALPLLVSNADCGPSNALQNLTKTFDRDRGVQQDQFATGRAGSSREIFRTQTVGPSTPDQDAARFFSAQRSGPQVPGLPAFDLSALQQALPAAPPQILAPGPAPAMSAPGAASWASDFLMQKPALGVATRAASTPTVSTPITQVSSPVSFEARDAMQTWNPAFAGPRMGMMSSFAPTIAQQQSQQAMSQFDVNSLDKEFQSFDNVAPVAEPINAPPPAVAEKATPTVANSDLARTAAELIHAVRHEENPKFRESAFMGLMRQLRDGEVVVDGNKFVPAAEATTPQAVDRKGKGKAIPQEPTVVPSTNLANLMAPANAQQYGPQANSLLDNRLSGSLSFMQQAREVLDRGLEADRQQVPQNGESDLDVYLRQQNEDYMDFWNSAGLSRGREETRDASAQWSEWDHLQRDWERYEATAAGIKAVPEYQFAQNNPYILGSSSRTRMHMMHTRAREAMNESVLELEAAVQRNPTDAQAWFELGVKQQENEREQKAVQALERALAIDPRHLPAWLALAISYTNEGQRSAAHTAIASWLENHGQYKTAYEQHRVTEPQEDLVMLHEKVQSLIRCLVGVVREQPEGGIDADVQIALAILLNINEEWEKSGDCFRAALSVRPDDWLLWNRVGATLANSGHADEALQFYNQAIQLNPLYIRARYNVGISLINTKRHWEAAEHLLDALVLQESDSTPDAYGAGGNSQAVTSSSLWDSLRTACQQMQRLDLSAMCERRDLEGFRAVFEAQRVS